MSQTDQPWNSRTIQPFGVTAVLPIVITARGVAAQELVTLSAESRIKSSRSTFSHLKGLAKAIAAHCAELGNIDTFNVSLTPKVESKFPHLTGLARAIAAHKAEQKH